MNFFIASMSTKYAESSRQATKTCIIDRHTLTQEYWCLFLVFFGPLLSVPIFVLSGLQMEGRCEMQLQQQQVVVHRRRRRGRQAALFYGKRPPALHFPGQQNIKPEDVGLLTGDTHAVTRVKFDSSACRVL